VGPQGKSGKYGQSERPPDEANLEFSLFGIFFIFDFRYDFPKFI
jgi:hypothetical protein